MRVLYTLMILFCFIGTQAQNKDSINAINKPESYFSFQYDNDFFSAFDRYYTQGIKLSLINPIVRYSPFSYALLSLKQPTKKYYGLTFSSNCFTPKTIRYDTLNYLERPYAALLYVSHSLSSINQQKQIALHTQLDLGIIGPCAGCEQMQKGIHKALDNIQPLGWENQLQTDFIINYQAVFEKGVFKKQNREVILMVPVRAGTLYTDAALGLTARMGYFSPYFSNLGIDKYSVYRKRNFQFYGIAKANAKFVAYNAALQGGLFYNENVYEINPSRINRVVVEAMAGFVLTYKSVKLEYSKYYITKEFKESIEHGWGKCLISFGF